MNDNPSPMGSDRKSTLAILALVAGVLSLLLLVASLKSPPSVPAQQIPFVTNHQRVVALFSIIVLAWALFSIPFVATLGTLLRPKGNTLAHAATLLSAGGILLLAFAIFTHIGALLSIVIAGNPPNPADDTYQAAIWANLGYYLTDPGLMAWGLGQFLFGRLAWKSGVLPNWLSLIGMSGGIAGLGTLAVYQTGVLAVVQLGSFAIWGFATGILLLRRGNRG